MTALDLINNSLRKLGVLANGETCTASEANDAFITFQVMLDSLSTESLIIFAILSETFSIQAAKQTYTFGTGGDFNSSRPQKIENAGVIGYGTNPLAELPMKIINKDEWASIIVKTVTSSIPQYLYNDNANPLSNINLWPVPSVGTSVVLYSWKPLSQYATLQSTIALPPGYLRMLIYNLAIDLAPDYGVAAPEEVVAIALQAKRNVKRMNSKPIYMSTDPALSGRKGAFNWLTGDTT